MPVNSIISLQMWVSWRKKSKMLFKLTGDSSINLNLPTKNYEATLKQNKKLFILLLLLL
jgi:hypothetical protein